MPVAERKPIPRISNAEVQAGIFLTFCLALFVVMLLVLGKFGHSLRGRQVIDVAFAQANSLRPEAPVLYNGLSIGYVQKISIVRVDDEMLARLLPITRRDVPNLPLSDSDRTDMASIPDDQLDAKARSMIKNRTMVVLTLSLLSENDTQRFRMDDEYRIDGSMMGDSSVEIRTGTGKPVPPNFKNVLMGIGGDMYTDLGKSLAQVKDILASMAEMAGGDATKRSIQGQLNNFDLFTQNMDEMSEAMMKKLPANWDSADTRLVATKFSVQEVETQVAKLKPKMEDSLGRAEKAISDLRQNAVASLKEGQERIADYRTSAMANLKELKASAAEYKDFIPEQIHDAREWSERFAPTVDKIDNFCSRADDQLDKGIDSLRTTLRDYGLSAQEIEGTLFKVKTWPWSFSYKPDTDEKAQQLNDQWLHELARRHYRELRKELEAVRASLNATGTTDQSRLSHIDQILRESDAEFAPLANQREETPPPPPSGRKK